MKRKYHRAGIALLASAALMLTACQGTGGGGDGNREEEAAMAAQKLADSIRQKYDEQYDYTDPIRGVARDEKLTLQMEFDIYDSDFTEYTQIVNVYQDAELKHPAGSHFEWDEETKVLSVTPPRWNAGGISTIDLDESDPGYDPVKGSLFEKGELKDWGNLPQYYMVRYVDTETGEPLDKPVVTVFTVDHEVSRAPRVSMGINEEGLPVFRWNEVPGAEKYYIMTMTYSEENGYSGNGLVRGSTEETEWIPDSTAQFITYAVSEADRQKEYVIEEYGEGTGAIQRESEYETYYCVIAASEDGTSAISNVFDVKDIARMVPFTEETGMSLSEEGSNYVEDFEEMPSYKWVTMCDGTLVQKIINYDFESAEPVTETWGEYEEEDMSDLRLVEMDLIKVPYTIDGTGFTGMVVIEQYDPNTWEDELEKIHKRQETLRTKGGARTPELTQEDEAQEDSDTDGENGGAATELEQGYTVTANSALSEYLAVNMMNANPLISLEDFPESSDQSYLLDAWEEAVYQNPMVLGVTSASILRDGEMLAVSYDTEADVIREKQAEIAAETKRVVSEIITDDMSELEKEMAINQYLCDTAEYDMAALENAEENDFADVDAEFNDSFTPYGVLLNKTGVCSSYAGAFKLLAEEAGLECIVVTGYLDGELPHAWNKVKIDGEWQIVDSTNNDNELIFNALLNLSDTAADKVLVEDERYALDSELGSYQANTDEKEYYRINNLFYEQDQITAPLTEELKAEGTAVLRTDYTLSDDEFMDIAQQVVDQYGADELGGYYWMGVIYLTDEY